MSRCKLLTGNGIRSFSTLSESLGAGKGETLLFVCPHDDDANVGAGMTIAQAAAEGFDVHILITSDGGMGYCDLAQKDTISEIRKKETIDSYKILGLPECNVHYLDFPDGQLYNYIGRRAAQAGDPELCGMTGLQNHFTYWIRQLSPARIFTPASTDLHPDHQAVYKDLLISIYHASGDIWPELGKPCALPVMYEYPIYVALDGNPELMLEGDEELFKKKLDSVAAYVSQKQIAATVEAVRKAGAVEFSRNLNFAIYDPNVYKKLFA
jgi:LmbE family N-acetylglucosaminyl deacetylase